MSILWLTVEVAPGGDIREAADEAVSLATKTGIYIYIFGSISMAFAA